MRHFIFSISGITPFNQIQGFLFCFVLPAIEQFKDFYVDLSVFPLVKKLKHSKKKLKMQSPQKNLNPEFHRQCSPCAISSGRQRHWEHEGAWVGGPGPAQVRGGAARVRDRPHPEPQVVRQSCRCAPPAGARPRGSPQPAPAAASGGPTFSPNP